MRANDIAGSVVSAVLGRLIRRATGAMLALLFVFVALGFFTAAALFALQVNLGLLYAELIVGAVYTVLAGGIFVGLVATRGRSSMVPTGSGIGSSAARNAQIAMVIEALMLGYMLANKTGSRRDH